MQWYILAQNIIRKLEKKIAVIFEDFLTKFFTQNGFLDLETTKISHSITWKEMILKGGQSPHALCNYVQCSLWIFIYVRLGKF